MINSVTYDAQQSNVKNVRSVNGGRERAMMHIVRISNICHDLIENDDLIFTHV
jgi:hypothetical protein